MRNKLLCWSMLAATVLVTVWRTLTLPAVARDGIALTRVSYPLLVLMAVVTAALLLIGRTGGEYTAPASRSRLLTIGGTLFGAVLCASSLWELVRFVCCGLMPAPQAATVNSVDRVLLAVSMLAGVLGGLFLAVWFVGLYRAPESSFTAWGRRILAVGGTLTGALTVLLFVKGYQTDTRAPVVAAGGMQRLTVLMPMLAAVVAGVALIVVCIRAAQNGTLSAKWFWLLLPLWAFARLARYNVVYAASVDISPAVYEFFLYALILLFLLEAAKHLSGAEKPSPRLRGMAAATAVLCVSASLSRLVLFLLGSAAAVAYCPIPTGIEAALGLFAAALTVVLDENKPRHSQG